ncbi:penicillin acylase family protein [Amycolatopsis sp. YIM 10]|uniref:penicillin acylase family protein n=1 Tax=Amycolatopsis sp. YIM 10 TaxID=2653857 RepID=UPI00129079F4|nr:penicillin acylase family protein [Amycolatopsis sp. YIM 10]
MRSRTARGWRALGLGGLLVASMVTGQAAGMAAAPEPDQVYPVDGLAEPVDILVDDNGVPHIYAGEHYDVYFAQGFNAARDRLWQIDLWRRKGLGQLSEVLGPAYVEQDRANRMFSYRGDIDAEWRAYGNDAKRLAESYTAGINAYIGLARENDELMPWEFEFLRYQPDEWAPEDVVRLRTHALVGNLTSEVDRAYMARDFGLRYEDIRQPLDAGWRTRLPQGLDLGLLPENRDELLGVYDLATQGVTFAPQDLEAIGGFGGTTLGGQAVRPADKSEQRPVRENAVPSGRLAEGENEEGSNSFAVSPGRTAVDGPLIASDPHRVQAVPSLRYAAHLNAPGIDVIGAGEPGLPGLSLGQNQDIAFGLTVFDIDQEDLYVYRTRPGQPNEYRYQDRWVPMSVQSEEIPVRGGGSETVEMKFTRHGPVIYEDPERQVAFGVRTVWSGPGTSAYFGSIEYMRDADWGGFLDSLNRWGTPGENHQYADAAGNIGWKPAGRTPVRRNWDGLLPVPGDGRYEWNGFYRMDQLPVSHNPGRGWLQTNNESRLFDEHETGPLPEYVHRKIGFEAANPWRALRTREVLSGMDRATQETMLELQTDHVSIPGRRLTAAIAAVSSDDPAVQRALTVLREWDHEMSLDSPAAALFDVWTDLHGARGTGDGFLGQALLEAAVDDPAAVAAIGRPSSTTTVDMIENPGKWFGGDAVAVRDAAIESSLAAAVRKLTGDQGADPTGWRYGFYNKQELIHPLSDLVDPETRRAIDIEPREKGPVNETVGDEGASWRYIAEPGNWDDAIAMNNPGQSGDPESPFYENLFVPWAEDKMFPLHYDREDVEANTAMRIRLEPAG